MEKQSIQEGTSHKALLLLNHYQSKTNNTSINNLISEQETKASIISY